METLQELEARIASARNLGQIVRTMRTLAAVSIRRYRAAVESLRRYSASVRVALRVVLEAYERPASDGAEEGPLGAVLLASDQGLCGAFNERLLEHAMGDAGRREPDRSGRVWFASGERGRERLEAAGERVVHFQEAPTSPAGILDRVQDLLVALEEAYSGGALTRAVVYYNEHLSGAELREASLDLIPFDPERATAEDPEGPPADGPAASGFRTLPLLAAPPGALLPHLVDEWYFVELYRTFAESLASENASRLRSMDGAERNIRERIADLVARHRRRRQEEITGELLDVIGGTEALEGVR